MSTGAIIAPHIDVAQVVLYVFWVFFAGLVYYLHRENKREGYPLESDGRKGRVVIEGWPPVPEPKAFRLKSGDVRYAPGPNSKPEAWPPAERVTPSPSSPLVPTGANPMLDNVGPGSWAQRRDEPDITDEGDLRIVPLRAAPGYGVAEQDPDPRGMEVTGCDGQVGGVVRDLWVDRSEAIFRYIEIETAGGRRKLLPMTMAKVSERGVKVNSIRGDQFADVPETRSPEAITLLEEDRICAYYGSGTLYATPARQEPWV